MDARLDRILVLSGLISLVMIVSVDVFVGPFYPGYDYYSDVISKLGAVDSPVAMPTNILFFLFGAFMALFGLGLYRNYAEDKFGRLGAVIFIIAGAGLSLIGVFQCDAQCIDVTMTAEIHQFFSEVPMMMTPFGLGLFVIHELKGRGFRGKGSDVFLYLFVITIILGGIFTAVHVELNLDRSLDGFYERLATYIPVSLMGLASLALYRKRFLEKGPKDGS
jgi:hypothetical membrane protein